MGIDDQFMFGRELLVAPVVEKEATSRKIYLPQGEWIDFNDGKTRYEGKQWITLPVTLGTIPLFVKRGSIIAQMPVMQYIVEKENAPLIFDIYPATEGRQAAFTLYEDDGETNNYRRNILGTISVTCRTENNSYAISIARKNENGWQHNKSKPLIINIHSSKKTKAITVEGQKVKPVSKEQWDKAGTTPTIVPVWNRNDVDGVSSLVLSGAILSSQIVIYE
jgi:alpha-glucosidase